MSYLVILAVSFFATLSVASPLAPPVNVARQSGCSSNTTGDFKMIAVSKANSTNQQPLYLGASSLAFHASEAALTTKVYALKLFGDIFKLKNGGMTVFTSDGTVAGTSISVPDPNGVVQFNRPVHGSKNHPVDVYCEVVTGNTTLLALNGDPDNFWTCTDRSSPVTLVVYKAEEAGSVDLVFSWETCVAVDITIIPHTPHR
ncbi:hypothetical protein EI94DRAFT_1284111 [Lactarius quietus]|nr:hypothetical protein EI94DRAFT_1284111 [Lactarius quietus]